MIERIVGASVSVIFMSTAYAGPTKKEAKKVSNNKISVDFSEVYANSLQFYPCSPEVEDSFRGLKIFGPQIVIFHPDKSDPITGAFARVIVCGTYHFKYDTEGLNGEFTRAIEIVAVDEKSGTTFKGKLRSIQNEVPFDGHENDHEEFSKMILTGYFNPNLASIMDLPPKSATYKIRAQLKGYKSNEIRIILRTKVW